MLKLLIGRASSGKTSHMLDEIKQSIEKDENKLYMLVPEQYSHSAERMLCTYCGNSVSLHGEVLTFSRLAKRIISETGNASFTTINNAGRVLLMSRALRTAMPDLQIFARHSGNASFIQKLVETASEFKNSCLIPENLNKFSETAEYPLNLKTKDLSLIFEIYWGLLGAFQIDSDDILEKAIEKLPFSSFTSGVKMWIDGFCDFSTRQLDLIKAFLLYGAEISIALTCDDLSGTSDVFNTTRETAVRLISIANCIGTQIKIEHLSNAFDITRELAFEQIVSGKSTFSIENNGFIKLLCADNPVHECEIAASEVISCAQSGMRWQDISIVTGNWENYRTIGRSIFNKFGVPIYSNEKIDILALPPVAFISSAIMTILSHWEYSSIFRYLKTGLCGVTREETDIIENYVLKWNISGKLWYMPDPWTFSPSGFGEITPDEQIELEQINDIRKRIVTPIIELQLSLKTAASVRGKIIALYAFLEKTNFPALLEQKIEDYNNNNLTQLSHTYRQIWDTLLDAMEQFCNTLGDDEYDLNEFLSLWELALSQYNIGSIPSVLDRVSFGDYQRVRRRGCKCLIVIGATDDCFPHLASLPGVFSDYERDVLIKNGLSLSLSSASAISRDLFTLYSSLTLPTEKLIIIYPESDLFGGDKRPSPIIHAISHSFSAPIEHIDVNYCRTSAIKPCFEVALNNHNSLAFDYCSSNPVISEKLKQAQKALKMNRGTISANTAKRLYGSILQTSASNIEKYYSCRYSFFLRYGLKIRPRTKAELDYNTIGLFMHYVLENSTREIKRLGGFSAISDSDCEMITKANIARYAETKLGGLNDKSGRFRYLFDRLSSDTVSVMINMAEELRSSEFEPLDFELRIAEFGDIPAPKISDNESNILINGCIDRVDGWLHDDKLYLRVIDYKTGIKKFSLTDIWHGLGLQMLVYLFALCENAGKRYGKQIEPAGLLYVPAHEVFVSAPRNSRDNEISKIRAKNICRSGLILNNRDTIDAMELGNEKRFIPVKKNSDGSYYGDALVTPERFVKLSEHIKKTILCLARELESGRIDANPYYKSQQFDACSFCDFRHECAFGDYADDSRRCITNLNAQEFWDRIESEEI